MQHTMHRIFIGMKARLAGHSAFGVDADGDLCARLEPLVATLGRRFGGGLPTNAMLSSFHR